MSREITKATWIILFQYNVLVDIENNNVFITSNVVGRMLTFDIHLLRHAN